MRDLVDGDCVVVVPVWTGQRLVGAKGGGAVSR